MSWTGKALLAAGLLAAAAALVLLGSRDERFRGTSPEDERRAPASDNAAPPPANARNRPRSVESLAPGVVGRATDADFDALVLGSSVPVLVEFYADWCVPCRTLAPVLEELAREVPEARVVKVDVDDSPELAARYGVNSIPRLLLFKRGELTLQVAGRLSKSRLKTILTR